MLPTRVIRGIRSWLNYHGISDNSRRIGQFLVPAKRIVLHWVNHRGGNRRITWARLLDRLKHFRYPPARKTKSMFQPC